ncbi:MAG: hypothetical protein K2O47_00675, partial [Muribaculaceae bacterium]|nr:hypothetical protein [Muribaculaceae bacterium]
MTVLSAAILLTGIGVQSTSAFGRSKYDMQFADYPVYNGNDLELKVGNDSTHFRLWSPKAQEVIL